MSYNPPKLIFLFFNHNFYGLYYKILAIQIKLALFNLVQNYVGPSWANMYWIGPAQQYSKKILIKSPKIS